MFAQTVQHPRSAVTLTTRVVFAIVAAVLLVTTGASNARAAVPNVSFYKGHWVGHEFVGTILSGNTIAICDEPEKLLTAGQTFTQVQQITGLTAVPSQEIALVLFKHTGREMSPDESAAARIAVNTFKGNTAAVNRWRKALGATVSRIADSYITEAKNLHGPYTVTMKVVQGAEVGNQGKFQVTVLSQPGKPVPNAVVNLSATNATLPSVVRTNGAGQALPSYVRTGIDLPVFNAQTALAPTAVLIGNATSGQQKLKAAAPAQIYKAHVGYKLPYIAPKQSYECTTECAGNPPVTTSACNPAGVVAQYVMTVDSAVNAVLTLNPGQCSSVTAKVLDAKTLVTQLRYKVNPRWTKFVTVSTIVIDCPPLPSVSVRVVCDCTTAQLELTLPVNTSSHVQAIYVNGAAVVTAAPGSTATYPVTIQRGSNTTISFAPAIKRSNGEWNVGGSLSLSVP